MNEPHELLKGIRGYQNPQTLQEIDLMLKFADMAGYQRHKKQLELLKE